jgi:hypothetical protein
MRQDQGPPHPTQAAPTSNAAAKVALTPRRWDGLGALLGISAAAMVLGAAVIILW